MNTFKIYIRVSFYLIVASTYINSKAQSTSDSTEVITQMKIRSLIKESDVDRFSGDYESAFDKLWDALILLKDSKFARENVIVHRNLGILFDIYNKDSLALDYLNKSIVLAKEYNNQGLIEKDQIKSGFFSLSNFWRDKEKYVLCLNYLDSCQLYSNQDEPTPYIMTDRGYCYLKLDKIEEAEEYLYQAKYHLEKSKENYVVAVLDFIGDLQLEKQQIDSAIFYYQESLIFLEKNDVLREFKPQICTKLANLYSQKGNYKQAFLFMEEAKKSSEKLFSATSKNNQRLFEIKNKYKEILEENERRLVEQDRIIAKKKREQTWFIFLVVSFGVIGTAVYLIFIQRSRLKKLFITRKLEKEKNVAVLEAKTKELTAYSLKMIEKEDAVNALLDVIKIDLPSKFPALNKKYAKGNDDLWDEFNMRFVELNSNFYETLREKHPDLSPTEERHCALIKLNFDSHEMSRILNISLQSVHTSRYRIRKKLKLGHDDSLQDYINKL